MTVDSLDFADRLAALQERVSRAAGSGGRSLSEMTIVAVTKGLPVACHQEAWRQGLRHFGESRVQETAEKKSVLQSSSLRCDDATWHLIGHLQTNKVKKALDLFDLIQSLDSLRLADALNREGEKRGRTVPCLVEIKVSEEPAKTGIAPESLEEFLGRAASLRFIHIRGLMTVAPYFEDPALTRPYFRRAREKFEKHRHQFEGPAPILSMGMSQDFEVAVQEGANMIRIGTAFFGERPAARQGHGE
jgi:pyridoxal phosphate enzyme (YggS family)